MTKGEDARILALSMCSARISAMRNAWARKWAELRTAAVSPASGVALLLLSIASFLVLLAVVMVVTRVVAG